MKSKAFIICLIVLCMTVLFTGCGKVVEMNSEQWVDGSDINNITKGTDSSSTTVNKDGTSNGKNSNNTDGKSNTSNKSGASNGSKSSGSTNVNSKKGMGGANVSVATWGGGIEVSKSSSKYSAWISKVKTIEKKYNCKLVFKDIENAVQHQTAFTSNAMAGIKYADIVELGSGWVFPKYLRAGYLHPLDNYVNLNDAAWSKECINQSVVGGKHYLLFTSGVFNHIGGIWFNKSVFKKFNQKDPAYYVSKNEWTTDTFLKLAKSTTGKVSGVDYYGFSLQKANIGVWPATYNGKDIQQVNGKYVYSPDQKYYAGLQFAYDLYNTQKVCPEMKQASSMWTSNRVAMITGPTYVGVDYAQSIDQDDLGWTYLPTGPGVAKGDYRCGFSSTVCWGIPSAAKNPEIIAKIMVDLVYPSKTGNTVESQLKSFMFDDQSYSSAVSGIKKAMQSMQLKPTYGYISNTIGWGDFGISSKISPQSYIASVKAQAQAELNEVWQQK